MKPPPLIAVADVEASSRWYQELHPHLGDPALRPHGNGVLLWFQVDDFEAAVERAREMRVEVLEGPRVNPSANHQEIWLRDRDGYVVVLASAYGEL
jgi:catechol 2,3-dioxygenase-like lactoylglutathione lyase family enzyme